MSISVIDRPSAESAIDRFHARFKEGSLSRQDLSAAIATELSALFKSFNCFHRSPAFWDDFLSSLYERVDAALDRFRDQGKPISRFFLSLLKIWRNDYLQSEHRNHSREIRSWETLLHELPFSAPPVEPPMTVRLPRPLTGRPKHILFLALKSYYRLSDSMLQAVAHATNIPEHALLTLIEQLHALRDRAESDIIRLRERAFSLHYKVLALQRDLKDNPSDAKTRDTLVKIRRRLAATRNHLSSVRVQASNRDIAMLLGLSKSAVDYSISQLKRDFYAFAAESGDASGNEHAIGRRAEAINSGGASSAFMSVPSGAAGRQPEGAVLRPCSPASRGQR
jgi:signal transduction histidine kinase